jgi:hypothetical protein
LDHGAKTKFCLLMSQTESISKLRLGLKVEEVQSQTL